MLGWQTPNEAATQAVLIEMRWFVAVPGLRIGRSFFLLLPGVLHSPLASAFMGPAGDYRASWKHFFVCTKKVFSPALRLHPSPPSAAITIPFSSVFLLQFEFPSLSTADLTSLVSLWCILKKGGFGMNLKQKSTMTLFLLLGFMCWMKLYNLAFCHSLMTLIAMNPSSYKGTPCNSLWNFLSPLFSCCALCMFYACVLDLSARDITGFAAELGPTSSPEPMKQASLSEDMSTCYIHVWCPEPKCYP